MDGIKPYAALEDAPALPPEDVLSAAETVALNNLEAVIEKNIRAFFIVGNALKTIREQRLYRAKYRAFEEYCAAEWDIQRSYANKQIAAYEVYKNLGTNCTQIPESLLPRNESQVRPLIGLQPEDQVAAWELTLDEAQSQGLRVTAKLVTAAAARLRPPALEPDAPLVSDYLKKAAGSFIDLIDSELKNATSNVAGIRSTLDRLKGYVKSRVKVTS